MTQNQLLINVAANLYTLADSLIELAEDQNEPKNEESQPIKIEQVRAVLAEKSQSGKQPQVKELITKYGAKKLTDIDPARYKELLQEAEEL